MADVDLLHNPLVVAGTLAGFEGFRRFRTALLDPLRTLLPLAVEVEAVPLERRRDFAAKFRARGFFVDEREQGTGRLALAGPFESFEALAASGDPADPDFSALAACVVRAVQRRFLERFDVPHARGALRCGRRPLVMAVLNVTPDSFSDGGRFENPTAAIERGLALAAGGADVLDVGAESTRPGSRPVPAADEVARLDPVLRVLLKELSIPVSIDTRKAEVAERYLRMGAAIVNDVSGLEFDPSLAGVAARHSAALVLNHARGTPETMQEAPHYDRPVAEVARELRERIGRAVRAGVAEERIVLDPGIGFGKRLEDNLDLLAGLEQLRSIGRPLLIGCSRKGFLGQLTGRGVAERSFATAATTAYAMLRGVKLIRVHEAAEASDVLSVLDAIDVRLRVD